MSVHSHVHVNAPGFAVSKSLWLVRLMAGEVDRHYEATMTHQTTVWRLTILIDARESVCDHNSAHNHHYGDNEVGHESIEAKQHVSPKAPSHFNDLQKGMRLRASNI